jgi:hypothetical protein
MRFSHIGVAEELINSAMLRSSLFGHLGVGWMPLFIMQKNSLRDVSEHKRGDVFCIAVLQNTSGLE